MPNPTINKNTGLDYTIFRDIYYRLENAAQMDISGNLTVCGELVVDSLTVKNESNMDVSGNLDINGDLGVTGDVDVSGNVKVCGVLEVDTLTIKQDTDVDVSGNLDVSGDLDVSGNTTLDGELAVSGNTTMNSNLDVSGNTTLCGVLEVDTITGKSSDTVDISGNLGISGLINGVEIPYVDGSGIDISGNIISVRPATTTVRIGKTWALPGTVVEASGNTNFINGFYVSLGEGQTSEIVACTYSIQDGSNCVVRLQQNNMDISGSEITVTQSLGTTSIGPIMLSNNDRIDLVVQSVDNMPMNLSFTVFLEHTTPIIYS
jgi:cytoskeletal protein CcmA (bactofilin family)